MKKTNIRKKAIIVLYTYLIMIFTPKIHAAEKIKYNMEYSITTNTPFASFNNHDIYISSEQNILRITKNNQHNIYIIDDRNNHNPDMAIYKSYDVKNVSDMLKIIQIINEYERRYPSKWDRSTESMLNEWLIHNLCYRLDIAKHRTGKVDLDNAEETKYLNLIESLITAINNNTIESIKAKIKTRP